MRRLTLLRHAHAEDRHPGGKDFDRRLDAQGLEQASASAGRLLMLQPAPTLILASPAQRTLQTARILLEVAGLPPQTLRLEERLYNAAPADILATIRGAPAAAKHLVIVGHNPGISEVAHACTGQAPDGLLTAQFCSTTYATASWRDIM